jgi:hypothetical protein
MSNVSIAYTNVSIAYFLLEEIIVVHHRSRRLSHLLVSFLVGMASPGGAQAPAQVARPGIAVESPAVDGIVTGVAIVRFRTENIRILSPFLGPVPPGALPAGHVHVTVDGAEWHWMHTSAEPIVITPLSAGEHTVTLELASADHRPLATTSVRFTVAAKGAPQPGSPAPMKPVAAGQPTMTQVHPQPLSSDRSKWEFNFTSGAFIPTGDQSGVLKNASLSAAQLSYVVNPQFAIASTFGWAGSRDLVAAGHPKLDVFTYDIGAETRMPRGFANTVLALSPFAGIGVGGRSYNYRSLHVDATDNVAAYGAAGVEIGVRRLSMRFEGRNYLASFKPLAGGGKAATRSDIVVMLGFRFARQ